MIILVLPFQADAEEGSSSGYDHNGRLPDAYKPTPAVADMVEAQPHHQAQAAAALAKHGPVVRIPFNFLKTFTLVNLPNISSLETLVDYLLNLSSTPRPSSDL